jgi:hypothetical protein
VAAEGWIDRDRLLRVADALVIGIAVVLPWSTSATSVLIVLWLVALLPSIDRQSLATAIAHPAAGLSVALCGIAALGFLWSSAPVVERFAELKSIQKLLVVPLLFIHFRRSASGSLVLRAYLISCTALLAVSWALWLWPSAALRLFGIGAPDQPYILGVPVKDYIVQSGEFVICALGLSHHAISAAQQGRPRTALAMAVFVIVFLANVFFVAAGRTSLIVYAVLLLILAFQRFGRRGGFLFAAAGLLVSAGIFAASPYLQVRAFSVFDEIRLYRQSDAETSMGLRLEFWRKSIEFVAAAPIIGHGTGSITELFRHAASGTSGASSVVTGNPHNVTLEVAVQFGLLGVAVLYAMWAAQLLFFRGSGFAEWMGIALVVQGIIGSLSLSYLFDFTTGWTYMFGVGVLGGMVLRKSETPGREWSDMPSNRETAADD